MIAEWRSETQPVLKQPPVGLLDHRKVVAGDSASLGDAGLVVTICRRSARSRVAPRPMVMEPSNVARLELLLLILRLDRRLLLLVSSLAVGLVTTAPLRRKMIIIQARENEVPASGAGFPWLNLACHLTFRCIN